MKSRLRADLVLRGPQLPFDELPSVVPGLSIKIWKCGDLIGPTIRQYDSDGWCASTGYIELIDLGEVVDSLMKKLAPFGGQLMELRQRYGLEAEISCVIDGNLETARPAINFPADLIKKIAEFEVVLDIDLIP